MANFYLSLTGQKKLKNFYGDQEVYNKVKNILELFGSEVDLSNPEFGGTPEKHISPILKYLVSSDQKTEQIKQELSQIPEDINKLSKEQIEDKINLFGSGGKVV